MAVNYSLGNVAGLSEELWEGLPSPLPQRSAGAEDRGECRPSVEGGPAGERPGQEKGLLRHTALTLAELCPDAVFCYPWIPPETVSRRPPHFWG